MRTMHPVLMTGVNEWNEDWLPRDEYTERLRILRQTMSDKGWDGLVIHGDCDRCPIITYLTNYYPIYRWAIALVGLEGDPKLLMAGSTRDLPAALDQSNLREMWFYGHADKLLPEWIAASRGRSRARLGAYGFSTMRPPIHQNVTAILEPIAELDHADLLLDERLFQRKRPREIQMIRMASEIVHQSLDTLAATFRSGSTATEAAIGAEKTARLMAVQDVRILVSFDGGRTLQPFFQMKPVRQDPLVVYLAVRYCGFWSEAMTTISLQSNSAWREVEAELDAIIKGVKPGMSGKQVSALADGAGSSLRRHPNVKDRVGYGIGSALEEMPIWRNDTTPIIQEGGVYALHAGVNGEAGAALTSAVVHVGNDASGILCRYAEARVEGSKVTPHRI